MYIKKTNFNIVFISGTSHTKETISESLTIKLIFAHLTLELKPTTMIQFR